MDYLIITISWSTAAVVLLAWATGLVCLFLWLADKLIKNLGLSKDFLIIARRYYLEKQDTNHE